MPTLLALSHPPRRTRPHFAGWLLLGLTLLAPCAASARDRRPSNAAARAEEKTRTEESDQESTAAWRARDAERIRNACAEQAASDQLLSSALRLLGGGRARFDAVRFTGLETLREEQVWAMLGGQPEGAIDADTAAGLLARLQSSGLFAEIAPVADGHALGRGQAPAQPPAQSLVREAGRDSGDSGHDAVRDAGDAPLTAAAAAARAAAAPPEPAPGAAPRDWSSGTLVLRLIEHPRVLRVTVSGLHETSAEDLLSHLFDTPSAWDLEKSREPRKSRTYRSRRGFDDDDWDARCPSPLPEREWLARIDSGFKPGLVWKGLAPAVERAVHWLREEGYPLATAKARLSAEGALALEVDEGRVEAVEVRGLTPRLAAEVERVLAFAPGAIFSAGELRRRLVTLRERFPFLERDVRHRSSGRKLEVHQEATESGGLTVTADNGPPPPPEREPQRRRSFGGVYWDGHALRVPDDEDDDWDDLDVDIDDWHVGWDDGRSKSRGRKNRRTLGHVPFEVVAPGRVAVWLHARAFDAGADWLQVLRHTPSTGFAPGLGGTLQIWDPGDRVHVALDGSFAVNTKRSARDAGPGADFFERLAAQEKVDWLIGARATVPALRLAELGAQLYTLTDTTDAWRMNDGDSYLYSALIARADREYFRRAGVSAFATFHFFDQLTLGGEVRRERFDALPNPRVWSLFNSDDPPPPAAPVDPGSLDSVLLRLEWATDDVALHRVGSRVRHAETSLVDRDDAPGPLFATLNTVELGRASPGSTTGQGSYTHAISDSRLLLDFGGRRLLKLRLRAAGGHDLPLEKQEGLGGWSALRGYDFKELRGDASLLVNLELRNRWVGGFLDVGTVHQTAGGRDPAVVSTGWLDPRLGAGAQFFFDRHARLELAWRLDGRAQLEPSARMLFGWEL